MRPAVVFLVFAFCRPAHPDPRPPPAAGAAPDPVPALELAAARYARKGYFAASSDAYRRLAVLRPGSPSLCAWQAAVVDNTLAGGSKREQVEEIRLLAAVDRTFAAAPRGEWQACHRALHDRLGQLVYIWNKEMTHGCTAFAWGNWPLLERLFHEFLADFPDDPAAPEARRQLERLTRLEAGEPRWQIDAGRSR